jgi:ABC-2 type transport system permease protein
VIRLLRVELTRLRWRRAVLVLLAACVLVPLVIFGTHAWDTRPVSESQLADAQAQLERELENGGYAREIERCERRPDRYGVEPEQCAEVMGPQLDWFLYQPQLDLQDTLDQQGLAVFVFVAGLLMLTGTTFVGADWNSGSMSNQLLFEPRRARIWLAKAGAVTGFAAAAMAAVLAAFWAGIWLLASSRDVETAAIVVRDIQWTSVRAVGLAAAAALGAYAVTMLFRSTVFTLGALFAVVVGSTVVLAGFGVSERWMPHANLQAVLGDGTRYYREPPVGCFDRRPPEGLDCRQFATLPLSDGALYLGAFLLLAVALSVWSFRRRDVP